MRSVVRRSLLPAAAAATLCLGALSAASAQGTLSTQGLGFPPGQLSTHAASMGGAIGNADPLSPLNPAAIGLLTAPIILFQAEPEYREVRVGNQLQRSSISRFPLFVGSLPMGSRWTLSASVSTLLDRTWETISRDTQSLGGENIALTTIEQSDGSISDVRIAGSFATTRWLRVGVAGHGFSGRDVVRDIRVFDDSLRFARDTQQTAIGFGGNAVSVGVQTMWPRIAAIGISYRFGGNLSTYEDERTVARASAPDHFGASLVYLGISGTTLAVRAARDKWSDMVGLSRGLNVHEGWDFGVGGDVTGPRFGASPVALRAGARWRTLPFSPGVSAVRERTLTGGFGFLMAGGRVELNLGALRASRTSSGSAASESAWTVSTGLALRP